MSFISTEKSFFHISNWPNLNELRNQNINFLNHFRSKRGNRPIKIGVWPWVSRRQPIKSVCEHDSAILLTRLFMTLNFGPNIKIFMSIKSWNFCDPTLTLSEFGIFHKATSIIQNWLNSRPFVNVSHHLSFAQKINDNCRIFSR